MKDHTQDTLPISADWLIQLRWVALSGITAVLAITRIFLLQPIPTVPLSTLLVILTISNTLLQVRSRRQVLLRPGEPGSILILDTLLLTGLLYWTGGASNPFSALYLVHVTLSGVVLGTGWSWIIAIISSLCYGALFLSSGMEHHHHGNHAEFSLHLQGMWIAFTLAAALIACFSGKITKLLRKNEQKLVEARHSLMQHERLASLTNLAAGAAHELATPLSTIQLSASELESSLVKAGATAPLIEDARLIQKEVTRCKAILDEMRPGVSDPELLDERCCTLSQVVSSLTREFPGHGADRLTILSEAAPEISVPDTSLVRALSALIDNALLASSGPVSLSIEHSADLLRFTVSDSGKGMTSQILSRIGEPFFTTRENHGGMGLGVFLARLFAERHGGSLHYDSSPEKGTKAFLTIPILRQRMAS